ncbi:MAG: DUF2608 domain-containing protein [Rhabdochlamydiaceae bacterium]|nr:DUF2608 domain-containing protein [Candidatus Amphrikana amoebophyrae]
MFKKFLSTSLLLALFIPLSFCEIIEIKEMKEAAKYITDDTLVIFDIDNTLMEPEQTLGNDQWFRHRVRVHQLAGLPKTEAINVAVGEWMSVQCITKMQLAEPGIDHFIKNLQEKNQPVMGLTTRGVGMATQTIRQLNDLNVQLFSTAPYQHDYLFENSHSVLYRNGILFTANTHKGDALTKLLDHIKFTPKHIVFINDKHDHITPVQSACETLKIPFVGLRYGYLDHKVEGFDSDVADYQFERFRYILSDSEAERILAQANIE